MKTYLSEDCFMLFNGRQPGGNLLNMTGGYAINITLGDKETDGVTFSTLAPSTEAVYQALKYSNYPEIQKEIFAAKNAFVCKKFVHDLHKDKADPMFDKPSNGEGSPLIKTEIMLWLLVQKYNQHHDVRRSLSMTGDKPIVEFSKHDQFWGAMEVNSNQYDRYRSYQGNNILGRLWMKIRDTEGHMKDFKPSYATKLLGSPVIY